MPPSIQDLWNLPVSQPTGNANPYTWPILAAMAEGTPRTSIAPGNFGAWIAANSTAVLVISGALFVLAIFGGKRR